MARASRRKSRTRQPPLPLPSLHERSSGILLHPTSLPGPHGVGDLGPAAHAFAEFLARAGQRWWQMLPVGPPGFGNSPYQALSSFAGNPLLISLEVLYEDGLLDRDDIAPMPGAALERVRYERAWRFKEPRLRKAFARFREAGGDDDKLEALRAAAAGWLGDYALFAALKRANGGEAWVNWEPGVRDRKRPALTSARRLLADEIAYQEFLQLEFQKQWDALRARCAGHGIGLIGDLPIFTAHDSADVWANRALFKLDAEGRLTAVAGVPPDYFSKTGQLWGNPLYRWDAIARRGYRWWIERMRAIFGRFEAVRIDHFIGFHRYWEVPAGATTAFEGRYRPGPGAAFFERLREELGELPVIAEDLGVVVPEVKQLRDRFGLPGMKILQFAFGDDPEGPSYRPHNFPRRCVCYTGTHDNDTTVGWWRDKGSRSSTRSPEQIRKEHDYARLYLGAGAIEEGIHWAMIRAAQASVADLAVFPMQDALGLGSRARMNRPGTTGGNWEWRATPDAFDERLAARLRQLALTWDRLPGATREDALAATAGSRKERR